MKDLKDTYTVMVLSNLHSKNYSFNMSKKSGKILLCAASFFIIFSFLFIVKFINMADELSELRVVYQESKKQEVRIQKFALTIDELKKKMVKLKELDIKLRMMTDLAVDPDDARLFGMGGEETAAEEENGFQYIDELEVIKNELMTLQSQAEDQEISLREVTDNMKNKQYMWAATPSLLPVVGWISSGFGKRISPFTGKLTMHKGIDIVARKGTPIITPADGKVIYTGFDNGFGNFIKIDHGYGKITLYGHLSSFKVKRSARVKRGDIIGYVGNTGLSTGPHLHYEILDNHVHVNPRRYILDM
ncbi:MAG: M23 family metallopeptidase [Nitrospirota bacterium]